MTEPLPVTAIGCARPRGRRRARRPSPETRDALVIGPGLGQEPPVREFVRDVLRAYAGAGASWTRTGSTPWPHPSASRAPRTRCGASAPIVVTPHPGEMARLVGRPDGRGPAAPARDRARLRRGDGRGRGAEGPAHDRGAAGRRGLRQPDRQSRAWPPAAPGDVLSGIIGALLARGLDGWTAAVAGVYLHGAAGDDAAVRRWRGVAGRGDILDSIPEVLRRLRPGSAPRDRGGRSFVASSRDPSAETEQLAADLAARFRGGEVVLLVGELGAGKTAFVRGLARGLGLRSRGGREPDLRAAHRLSGAAHAAPRRPLPPGRQRRRARARPRGAARAARRAGRRVGGAPGASRRGPRVHRVQLEHAGEDERRITIEEPASVRRRAWRC